MKLLLSILAFFHILLPPLPVNISPIPTPSVAAPAWYFPLRYFNQRDSLKSFGEYFSASSYIGKSNIFPNHYLGYHAGSDIEILPGEANADVGIYAVGQGEITFVGPVSGYGGVILEHLEKNQLTALYGHISYTSAVVKVGDKVSGGTLLAYLGKAFSPDTGGERKHLHLGIYKGGGKYFKGYEPTLQDLNSHWLDPIAFLRSHSAVSP